MKPQYIVAIGTSAGGLEALTSFFENTYLDSASYIIIPHLSPEFKSQMAAILSKHSHLEVLEATEGMIVEVNKAYLIPNTKYMGIKDGKLFMLDKKGQSPPHMTVDAFFTSLAAERGPRAIAVVLSGLGNDGARGAMAIENARDVYTRRQEGVSIWVVAATDITASSPDEKDPMFAPSGDKVYRHPTFYEIPDNVPHM